MTEQERREAVAAVPVHERQVEAAQARIDGATRKVEKFQGHLDGIKQELQDAQEALVAEEEALRVVRIRAEEVLSEGPVSISGIEVRALAGIAGAEVAGKGGGN